MIYCCINMCCFALADSCFGGVGVPWKGIYQRSSNCSQYLVNCLSLNAKKVIITQVCYTRCNREAV